MTWVERVLSTVPVPEKATQEEDFHASYVPETGLSRNL